MVCDLLWNHIFTNLYKTAIYIAQTNACVSEFFSFYAFAQAALHPSLLSVILIVEDDIDSLPVLLFSPLPPPAVING